MKNKTIKILAGACVIVICLAPGPQEASEFNLVEDNNIKIENINESCNFTFVPFSGSIGIKK